MAARVLGIATGAVLLLLGGLWFLIGGDEPNPAHDISPTAAPTPAPAASPAPIAPTGNARVGSAAALPTPSAPVRAAPPAPVTPALAPIDAAAPKTPDFRKVLSEQIRASENLVVDCADKTASKVTGETAVSYTLARHKDGRILLESTGVEYSSITDQSLMECIRATAKEIYLESLPEGAEAILGYRQVILKDGVVIQNRMTDYSVARPAPP
jgi:hypothetical protein